MILESKSITEVLLSVDSAQLLDAMSTQNQQGNTLLHLVNDEETAYALMICADKLGILEQVMTIQNKFGNTPLNHNMVFYSQKELAKDAKAIFHKVLENGNLLAVVLTLPNNNHVTPLEKLVFIDELNAFKSIIKKAQAINIDNKFTSFSNVEDKPIIQIAKEQNANKIEAYLLACDSATKFPIGSKELLKVIENGISKNKILVLHKANEEAAKELVKATAEEEQAKTNLLKSQSEAAKYSSGISKFDAAKSPAKATRAHAPKTSAAQNKQFWAQAEDNLKAATNIHKQKLIDKHEAEAEAALTANNIKSVNKALLFSKTPQLADDLNWGLQKASGLDVAHQINKLVESLNSLVNKATGSDAIKNMYYHFKTLVPTATNFYAAYKLSSPFTATSAVLQNKAFQDTLQKLTGEENLAKANLILTTGLVATGFATGALSLPIAGTVAVIQGLEYITQNNPLAFSKPAVELAVHTTNIAYPPTWLLKSIEVLNTVRNMVETYEDELEKSQTLASPEFTATQAITSTFQGHENHTKEEYSKVMIDDHEFILLPNISLSTISSDYPNF